MSSKVIEISKKRTLQSQKSQNTQKEPSNYKTQIIDFKTLHSQRYQPVHLKERRQVERTLLSELIKGMVIVPEKGLLEVELYDISKEGLSFNVDTIRGGFKVGEELALRVYLNRNTYFPLVVHVKHVTMDHHENVIRHGVEYTKEAQNFSSIDHFVNFVLAASEGLKIDEGDFIVGPITPVS